MTDPTAHRPATSAAYPAPRPSPAGAAAPGWTWAPPHPSGAGPQGRWEPPDPGAAPRRTRQGPLRRIAGAAGAALFGLLKYGALVLKVGKLGPMLISMGLSLLIFARLFGVAFGIGVVGLILVHEMGHVIAARVERVPASLPFFLGPFGALILTRRESRDARQDAVIGIGGPLLGTAGALVLAGAAQVLHPGHAHSLLLALAYFGFFLNLFNLTPALPFDGGRVAGAVSIWFNVAGLVIMAGLIVVRGTGVGVNPFLVVLLLLGVLTTVRRFRNRHRTDFYRAVPVRVRALIGASWAALIIVTAVGMGLSHRALIDAGTIDNPAASTTSSSAD